MSENCEIFFANIWTPKEPRSTLGAKVFQKNGFLTRPNIHLYHGSRTLRLRYAFWQFRDDSIRLRDALILSGKTIVNVL